MRGFFLRDRMLLSNAQRSLDLSQPQVMGILNLTPDSFSDGGCYTQVDLALEHALQMVEAGAALIDLGGESTRPGAAPVSAQQECDRVLPVLQALRPLTDAWISVDTSNPELMREAAALGADLINDVRALRQPGALEAAAASGLPVCLMHMRGEPGHMQTLADYESVMASVESFLTERIHACEQAGIKRDRLLLDPGFGFAKTLAHNLQLLKNLSRLGHLGLPLLVGMSRKRMLGDLTGRPADQRLGAGIAAHLLAVDQGASIVRVHDVAPMVDALKVWQAVQTG